MAKRVGFWVAWYVPQVVLWLAFVDTFARQEVIAGLVAAAVAATAAELVRSQELVRFRLDPRWLRGLPGLPWQVLRDTWLLTVALWRHCTGHPVRGVFRVVPFPSEADDNRSAARRPLSRSWPRWPRIPWWSGSRATRGSCWSTSWSRSPVRRCRPACWRIVLDDPDRRTVNEWAVAALALLAGLVPCGVVCLRGSPVDRLIGLELAGTVDTLVLLLLAQAYDRAIYFDLALALALLSFAGGLVFARFLERWI
jgi:multicomponent Na+:H+ antiporter subunit F